MLSYLRRLFSWIKRAAFVFFSLAFFGLCVYLFIYYGATESKSRMVGFVFQCVCLLFAGYALYKTENYFMYPVPTKRIMAWIKDFPPFKQKPIVGSVSCTLEPATMTGHAYSEIPAFDNIEDRVKYLEELMQSIFKQMYELNQSVGCRMDDIDKKIYDERNIRIAELSRVQDIVVNNAVSGAVLAELGFFYLFASCIFLSFPQELADLLR